MQLPGQSWAPEMEPWQVTHPTFGSTPKHSSSKDVAVYLAFATDKHTA